MRGVALCVLAACGTAPAATHPARVAERPYLKLIEPDNEWTLPIKSASGHYDDGRRGPTTWRSAQLGVHLPVDPEDLLAPIDAD